MGRQLIKLFRSAKFLNPKYTPRRRKIIHFWEEKSGNEYKKLMLAKLMAIQKQGTERQDHKWFCA
jgi:hypothetical protein